MSNVHPIRPHADRKASYEAQRVVAAAAVRRAAVEVGKLAKYSKGVPK